MLRSWLVEDLSGPLKPFGEGCGAGLGLPLPEGAVVDWLRRIGRGTGVCRRGWEEFTKRSEFGEGGSRAVVARRRTCRIHQAWPSFRSRPLPSQRNPRRRARCPRIKYVGISSSKLSAHSCEELGPRSLATTGMCCFSAVDTDAQARTGNGLPFISQRIY